MFLMNRLKHLVFVSKNFDFFFFNIKGWKVETIKTKILRENT